MASAAHLFVFKEKLMKKVEKCEITVSISKENYESLKKCADIMDLDEGGLIDKLISNKIPSPGEIEEAEYLIARALAAATVNFGEDDAKQLLENLINAFEKLKSTDAFSGNKRNCFDMINKYFRISGR